MLRIRLDDTLLAAAQDAHYEAIRSYVAQKSDAYQEKLFSSVHRAMPYAKSFHECIEENDWNWLRSFILADVEILRTLTAKEELLQFDQFLKLYNDRFSAGASKYVDDASQYNAYTFIQNLGVTVCPYCDEEYLDVLTSDEGKKIRTLELDHFFPKGQYPALAMCFYNLVPSGQSCNGIKLKAPLGMSPYEENIETCTYIYPDLPLGINMENVSVDDCTLHFHPKGGMTQNVETLCLEERYEKHKGLAHRYLTIKQEYDDNKIAEMVRAGFFPSAETAYRFLYGEPLQDNGQQQILRKLKHDLIGR